MKRYQNALVLGYGRSGRAAEQLLHAEGTPARVITRETDDDAELAAALSDQAFDVCIVSPGFALDHPWMAAVREAGVPLLSELELGWSRHRGKTIAVTGSNGKSTAVKWLCESMQEAGLRAAVAGNYGIPACEAVFQQPDLEWLVLEVSSFQLETADRFRAEVAVVLNILPNHLDRHGTMEAYWRTKARIFRSSAAADACLVPAGWLARFREEIEGDRRWMTFGETGSVDFRFYDGRVYSGARELLNLSGTPFDNSVIGACTGAAVAGAAAAAGIAMAAVESAARRFVPLPYRMQQLGEIGGVLYVNDSKATNLAAMAAAVRAAGNGVHLIAGGLSKESDYSFVKEILAERVRRIYLTGQASRAMYEAWNGVCPCIECDTLENAFRTAGMAAAAGETVLFSPACASFDQFRSFEERGECFNTLFQSAMHAGGDAV